MLNTQLKNKYYESGQVQEVIIVNVNNIVLLKPESLSHKQLVYCPWSKGIVIKNKW